MPPDSSLHLHWRLEVVGTNDPVLRIAQWAAPCTGVWRTEAGTQTADTVLQYQVPPSTIHTATAATLSFGWKTHKVKPMVASGI